MGTSDVASVSGGGDYRRIEVRRVVNAPIERVWNAITSADEIRHWWAAGSVDPREGGRVKLGDGEATGSDLFDLDGRVKVCLPPHVFEFTWNEAYDPAEGLVRFDLVETAGGRTQITLVNMVPTKHVVGACAGWHQIIERLDAYLQIGTLAPTPEDDARFRELKSMYGAVVN